MSLLLKFKKWPTKSQWGHLLKVFTKKEKFLFFVSLVVFCVSIFCLFSNIYTQNTDIVPKLGGTLKEGVVGQPQFVNPVYSYSSTIDQSIVELVFSGLLKYDENGEIVNDLIDNYEFKEDGKVFEFTIRDDVKWHDGTPLTIDDVIFTLNVIQDSKYMSPLRMSWQGVEIEKKTEYRAALNLKQPYSGLLQNLAELKIIPKNIWENIPVQSFSLSSDLNLFSPIGSGPYVVEKTEQREDKTIKSIQLKLNPNYYSDQPYIENIVFYFFNSEEELSDALEKGIVDAASFQDIIDFEGFNSYAFSVPNFFSIFLNNQDDLFKDEGVRIAIASSIDKEQILETVLENKGETVDSPLLPGFFGLSEPESVIEFNLENANDIFEENDFALEEGERVKTVEKFSGFQFSNDLNVGSSGTDVEKLQECLAQDEEIYPDGEITGYFGSLTKEAVIRFQEKYADEILAPSGLTQGTGKVAGYTREKLNQLCYPNQIESTKLELTLTTTEHPILIKVANLIKSQLEQVGIKVDVEVLSSTDIKKVIRERNYQALLFGQTLNMIPDPLPFWHSSQMVDPGLNISLYENETVDELSEKARLIYDYKSEERNDLLRQIQSIITEDSPTIPLYSPQYVYIASDKIKGIEGIKISDSSKRYTNIKNWYIQTKRVWK